MLFCIILIIPDIKGESHRVLGPDEAPIKSGCTQPDCLALPSSPAFGDKSLILLYIGELKRLKIRSNLLKRRGLNGYKS